MRPDALHLINTDSGAVTGDRIGAASRFISGRVRAGSWRGISVSLRVRCRDIIGSVARGKSDTVAELTAHRAGPKPTSYEVKMVLTSGAGKKRSIILQMTKLPPSKPLSVQQNVSVCTSQA